MVVLGGGAVSVERGTLVDSNFNVRVKLRNGLYAQDGSNSSYRGTSLIRKRTPLEPYRRPMPRVRGGFLGAAAVSVERGSHVDSSFNVHMKLGHGLYAQDSNDSPYMSPNMLSPGTSIV